MTLTNYMSSREPYDGLNLFARSWNGKPLEIRCVYCGESLAQITDVGERSKIKLTCARCGSVSVAELVQPATGEWIGARWVSAASGKIGVTLGQMLEMIPTRPTLESMHDAYATYVWRLGTNILTATVEVDTQKVVECFHEETRLYSIDEIRRLDNSS